MVETENFEVKRGILQGDSLSPLLFYISLIPLTQHLNKLNEGHEEHTAKSKVSHLPYMDHLQLIGETEEELQKQMQVVRTFSDDIHKEFGLEKCAKILLKRGKLVQSQNLTLDFNREIQELEQGKTHKYLRIEELRAFNINK
jgi:hypothetical protein